MPGQNGTTASATDQASIPDDGTTREKKRKRGGHACDTCRHRKVKCDGDQPCRNCLVAEIECTYGADAQSKGKSDHILEGVQRIETSLAELRTLMATAAQTARSLAATPYLEDLSRTTTIETPASVSATQSRNEDRWANAVLSAQHISSTESILRWQSFDKWPQLRQDKTSVFLLEQQRRPLIAATSTNLPDVSLADIRHSLDVFTSTVNFIYPIATKVEIDLIGRRFESTALKHSAYWCRALLAVALGYASRALEDATINKHAGERADPHCAELALTYFELFQQRSYVVHNEISTTSTQCLLLAGLFFAYLQRPLQAWSFINLAAIRCRMLLSYGPGSESEDSECLRRIFWSCFVLESDYTVELPALPQSGIGGIESTVPLPANYHSSHDVEEQELSSLYFTACISMRRLLNRVHDLLYAPRTGLGLDEARFPDIVRELDRQLEEWRAYLPQALSFTLDAQDTANEHAAFLRQRYLACRSVIYRPYLTQVLQKDCDEYAILQSEICLDACISHIANLRPFRHTVLVDTWICALSMSCSMLLLLAALDRPQLKAVLHPKLASLGPHLTYLIGTWITYPSERAPSIDQSLRIIQQVTSYITEQNEM